MPVSERPRRAAPMSPDDRRIAIARAAVPLLVEHGRDVTTKQLAEAAGVAEGTLFRVFDDKDAIIDAAVVEFLDPAPFRDQLRGIDPEDPLETKIEMFLGMFQQRMSGIFGVVAAVGMRERPPFTPDFAEMHRLFETMLEPELQRLRVPPATVFAYARLVAFATALPQFAETTGLDTAELARLIVHGIAADEGHPTSDARQDASGDGPAPPASGTEPAPITSSARTESESS
ncbi:TetR/AcrR family transcriptional regulator [Agromyces seonyuensis]|uniref:TetR/AcrR family transcriptional regulator n=1 Tax=Agromyces seonyuensis TaxID=2662446 RepID=UPI00192158A0|nr:TetR/AcrR family transcriptional regulator [Agromyces seonyuensis]